MLNAGGCCEGFGAVRWGVEELCEVLDDARVFGSR
jgi:hypothetical protein